MITTLGEQYIIRQISRVSFGQSIALGVLATTETVGDQALSFESIRVPVTSSGIDLDNNRIILKAVVPSGVVGKFYEVGLFSAGENTSADNSNSKFIFSGRLAEGWMTPLETANSRVGEGSIRLSPAAGGTETSANADLVMDLSGYSDNDIFVLAYYVDNNFVDGMEVRIGTDQDNYFSSTLPAQTAGYQKASWLRSEMVKTGNPQWSNINYIYISVTADAGGSPVVDVDALRIEDTDTLNLDHVLINRKVLDTPVTKLAGVPLEIEFPLTISAGNA